MVRTHPPFKFLTYPKTFWKNRYLILRDRMKNLIGIYTVMLRNDAIF